MQKVQKFSGSSTKGSGTQAEFWGPSKYCMSGLGFLCKQSQVTLNCRGTYVNRARSHLLPWNLRKQSQVALTAVESM